VRSEVREKRIEFMIIKIIKKTLLVLYTLGSTVTFPMLRKLVGNLLQVIFCNFFDIFFIFRKIN
jgi:hypothetical protein